MSFFALIFLFVLSALAGCRNVDTLEKNSSGWVFIVLLLTIVYFRLTPKIHQWRFTKNLMSFFINHIAIYLIWLYVVFGFLVSYRKPPIGIFLALSLFMSSAFLYKLRKNYNNKSIDERTKEFRYFTITLPPIIALFFLLCGGLEKFFIG
jgi:hypothetical protein